MKCLYASGVKLDIQTQIKSAFAGLEKNLGNFHWFLNNIWFGEN